MLRIGVSFDGFATFGESLDTAREAETAGARSFWMAEHLGYRDPLTSCMAFALATRESTVVPTAISPFLRNPVPLAMSLATLAEAAPGRVAVAIGVGNPMFLAEAGLKLEKPLAANREYLDALRGLWSGEPVHAPEAMLHRLAGARMMFKPPQPIPVYLAPMKEQMLRFAGREADGVVLSAGLSAEYARVSLGLVAEGARAAGRDPAGVHAAAYIFFVASKDERDAMAKSRRKLAFVLRNRYIDDAVAHSGIPIDQEAIIAAIGRRDLDAAAALVPEEAVEAFAVWGSRRRCAQRLQQYVDAGVREPVLFLTGEAADRAESLAVIAEFAPG
ncbi:MAG: LLM class flavin-dependent oxidoreductase [Pseudomonadota bacterium]